MKIALVTREFAPVSRNGGIGTAMRHLATALMEMGHEVRLFYSGRPSIKNFSLFKTELMEPLHPRQIVSVWGLLLKDQFLRSKAAFRAIKNNVFDVLLFHEYQGEAFSSIRAKKAGMALPSIGVIAHGPSQWVDEGNGRKNAGNGKIELMELYCCENADFLISPSRYLLDWMRAKNWRLPQYAFVIPNFVSDSNEAGAPKLANSSKIDELVFFGRLETRKGVDIFCEAIKQLPHELLTNVAITFLGKEDHYTASDIRELLGSEICAHEKVVFQKNLGRAEALVYLKKSGRLAVMPSRQENSPCAVAECIENGIPFVASSVGGGKELADNGREFFVEPNAARLAEKLSAILRNGIGALPAPAWNRRDLLESWEKILTRRFNRRDFMATESGFDSSYCRVAGIADNGVQDNAG